MSIEEPAGMSLKMVSVFTISCVAYLLWGGAAAIYKSHLDHETALTVQADGGNIDDSEFGEESPQIRIRRGSGIVTAIVVCIAGVWTFVSNSVVQLGHLPDLIPYLLHHRMGYLIFSAVTLMFTGLGLLGMARMQASLASENPFSKGRKKRKLPKIRTPRPLDDS